MNRILVAAVASLGMLTASAAMASNNGEKDKDKDKDKSPPTVAAPEIDVVSAALGAGILIAGLLLVAEGLRRRR